MAVHSHIFKDAADPRHGHEHHHVQHREQAHGHQQTHGHQHAHEHHHGHGHGHGHGKEDSNKFMTGDRYWRWPGLRETALKTSSSVINALAELGISREEMANLDVIEIGCGGGAVTRLLAPTFGSITAIDIEPTMIASLHSRLSPSLFASSRGSTTAFVHTITSASPYAFSTGELQSSPTDSDAERQVKPPKAQFDVAVIINVLHHVENPNDFFPGLQGLMKKGGKVVVIEPNGLGTVPPTGQHVKLGPEEGIDELSEAELEAMKSHGHNHSHFFTVDKLSEAFTARGFKVLLAKEDGTMPTQGVGRDEMRVGVVVAEA